MSKLDSVIMNSKEMQLVTGGDANIPMKAAYKNKESCKSEGAHLLDIHVVNTGNCRRNFCPCRCVL